RSARVEPSTSHEECLRAGPAAEPGRLEIEEHERRARWRAAAVEDRVAGCLLQPLRERPDDLASVARRRLPSALDDEAPRSPLAAERARQASQVQCVGYARWVRREAGCFRTRRSRRHDSTNA